MSFASPVADRLGSIIGGHEVHTALGLIIDEAFKSSRAFSRECSRKGIKGFSASSLSRLRAGQTEPTPLHVNTIVDLCAKRLSQELNVPPVEEWELKALGRRLGVQPDETHPYLSTRRRPGPGRPSSVRESPPLLISTDRFFRALRDEISSTRPSDLQVLLSSDLVPLSHSRELRDFLNSMAEQGASVLHVLPGYSEVEAHQLELHSTFTSSKGFTYHEAIQHLSERGLWLDHELVPQCFQHDRVQYWALQRFGWNAMHIFSKHPDRSASTSDTRPEPRFAVGCTYHSVHASQPHGGGHLHCWCWLPQYQTREAATAYWELRDELVYALLPLASLFEPKRRELDEWRQQS